MIFIVSLSVSLSVYESLANLGDVKMRVRSPKLSLLFVYSLSFLTLFVCGGGNV